MNLLILIVSYISKKFANSFIVMVDAEERWRRLFESAARFVTEKLATTRKHTKGAIPFGSATGKNLKAP